MTLKDTILASAKKTILSESKSIAKLSDLLTNDFASAVEAIFNCKGRLVVTGIGKSAIIAQKIVATFWGIVHHVHTHLVPLARQQATHHQPIAAVVAFAA